MKKNNATILVIEPKVPKTVWVVTSDTDNGLINSVYTNKTDAYKTMFGILENIGYEMPDVFTDENFCDKLDELMSDMSEEGEFGIDTFRIEELIVI